MGAEVHATALVDASAVICDGAQIGPYAVIGADVLIGEGTRLEAFVTVLGPTRLGRRNRVYPGAVIGAPPQDRSYAGEPTRLEIGDDNELREQVTIHRGTPKGGGVTRVGSRCLLMVGVHVAHDCVLGDDVVLANLTTLGGHVTVQERVVCGGQVAVAPFVRLGRAAFLAGGARVERDVPPFVTVAGDRARVRSLNRVGLERMGVPAESVRRLEHAFRLIWGRDTLFDRGVAVARAELGDDAFVAQLLAALAPAR